VRRITRRNYLFIALSMCATLVCSASDRLQAAPIATVTIDVDNGLHVEVIQVFLNQDFQNPENYFGLGFSFNNGGFYGLGAQFSPGVFSNQTTVAAISGVSGITGNRDTRAIIPGMGITNISGQQREYRVTFTLTDAANFATSLTRGVTEQTASGPGGTSYGSIGNGALYVAQIDGNDFMPLLPGPQSFNLQPSQSINASDDFGGPVANPTEPGGAVNNSVGIAWRFTLDPDATASFNSNFYAVVPEPSSILLMGFGIMALAWSGYRQRRRNSRQ